MHDLQVHHQTAVAEVLKVQEEKEEEKESSWKWPEEIVKDEEA